MLQDKDFITPLSDLCRDPNFKNTFAALVKNEKFIDIIRPLFIENLQCVLEARQEEARSHNLDTTLKSFKRVSRKLLSLDNSDNSDPIARAVRELAIRELKEAANKCTCKGEIIATFVCTAIAASLIAYCYNLGKRESLQKNKKYDKLKVEMLEKEIQELRIQNKWLHSQAEVKFKQVYELKERLQPVSAYIKSEQSPPPRRESSPPPRRESSPPPSRSRKRESTSRRKSSRNHPLDHDAEYSKNKGYDGD